MKKLSMLIASVALMTGCITTPHEYNDPVDPSQVTTQELADHAEALETIYQQDHQVEGIIWQAYRSDLSLDHPDRYGSGGDSCIFTGHKLAADVYRYSVTKNGGDLNKVAQSLRGLYILSHITGTPGVLCRAAYPADRASEWGSWAGRDQRFVHTSGADVADPFNPGVNFPAMNYYTRATKDQLTGLLYGLAVLWEHLEAQDAGDAAQVTQLRLIAARIAEDVYNHLRAHDFKIRDENGANDTTADTVSELLYVQLLAVYRSTVGTTSPDRQARISQKYDEAFSGGFFTIGNTVHVFTNFDAYYAWNLRHLRGYSVFILENDAARQATIRRWMEDRVWDFVAGHYNAKFIYIQNAVNPALGRLGDAHLAMQSLRLKPRWSFDSPLAGDERKPSLLQALLGDTDRFVLLPHLRKPTSYSIWQKEPWDVGHAGNNGSSSATGLDFMLAYWMGRYYGFISAP
jgi:hypothetical protein